MEGSSQGLIEVLLEHLLTEAEENNEKSVRIAFVSAEIRKWLLLITTAGRSSPWQCDISCLFGAHNSFLSEGNYVKRNVFVFVRSFASSVEHKE